MRLYTRYTYIRIEIRLTALTTTRRNLGYRTDLEISNGGGHRLSRRLRGSLKAGRLEACSGDQVQPVRVSRRLQGMVMHVEVRVKRKLVVAAIAGACLAAVSAGCSGAASSTAPRATASSPTAATGVVTTPAPAFVTSAVARAGTRIKVYGNCTTPSIDAGRDRAGVCRLRRAGRRPALDQLDSRERKGGRDPRVQRLHTQLRRRTSSLRTRHPGHPYRPCPPARRAGCVVADPGAPRTTGIQDRPVPRRPAAPAYPTDLTALPRDSGMAHPAPGRHAARPVDEHDQSRCGVAITVDRHLVRAFGYLCQQHLTGGSKDEHPGSGQGQRVAGLDPAATPAPRSSPARSARSPWPSPDSWPTAGSRREVRTG